MGTPARSLFLLLLALGIGSASAHEPESASFRLTRSEFASIDGSTLLLSSSYRLSRSTLGDSIAELSLSGSSFTLATDWTATLPPALEVESLRFESTSRLIWQVERSLGTYRIYRGGPTTQSCIGQAAQTHFEDAALPSPSSAFYFLVTAVDAGGVEGSAGRSSSGSLRTPSGSCP